MFPSILQAARRSIARALPRGGIALDGTAGRGRDTLFLARWVGPGGFVFAFDPQPDAILQTRHRLAAAGVADRVTLFEEGHECLGNLIDEGATINAAMFNLGYLPGSDKRVTTQATSTIRALDAVYSRLTNGAAVTVVVYPGHPGGEGEEKAVEGWFGQRAGRGNKVACYRFLTRRGPSPILFALKTRR